MNSSPNTLRRCGIVRSSHSIMTGVILWCVLTVPSAFAQQASPSQPQAPKDVLSAVTAPRDALSDDPLLETKISLLRRHTTVAQALNDLSQASHCTLAADSREIQFVAVALSVEDEPLRDVLRSLAALNGWQWRRTAAQDGRPILLLGEGDNPHRWDFLAPITQASSDEHRAVQDFQNQFASLPPEMQQALGVPHRGVPFADLPVGMQQSVRDALTARNATLASMFAGTPFHIPITSDNVDSQWVVFNADRHNGSTEYDLDVRSDDLGSVGMATTVPDDPQARDASDTMAVSGQPQYQDVRQQALQANLDQSRDKAKKDDTRLSQTVSVRIADSPLGFALADISHQTHVNIVAQVFDETHTVSLGPVPLKDALDQITAKYHAAWGVATDGTILVRNHTSNRGMD